MTAKSHLQPATQQEAFLWDIATRTASALTAAALNDVANCGGRARRASGSVVVARRKTIELATLFGLSVRAIARCSGLSCPTIRYHRGHAA